MSAITRSTIGYYADFYVYPLLLAALAVASFSVSPPASPPIWIGAVFAGLLLWTLVEYVIHRLVLHKVAYFRDLHEQHHQDPAALIGTPTWISLSLLFFVVFLPAWVVLGPALGCGFTFGMTAGYFAYGFAHYGLHHWRLAPGHPLYSWKRAHALHHFRHDEGNFGVTTLFWDHVFGTALKGGKRK